MDSSLINVNIPNPSVWFFLTEKRRENKSSKTQILRKTVVNVLVFLLLGSLIVGIRTSDRGWEKLEFFTGKIFYGMLTFFLLDMSSVAARRISKLPNNGLLAIGFLILRLVFNVLVGIAISKIIGMSPSNVLLFAIFCFSTSYIAVSTAMKIALFQADLSLYILIALASIFLFNII